MQFGTLTLEQWHATLATPPSTPPKLAPPMPLTWAARVAAGGIGIHNDAFRLPSPRTEIVPPSPPGTPSSVATSSSGVLHEPVPAGVWRGNGTVQHLVGEGKGLPRRLMRGLINCGNSCFINVVLQALLACHAFRAMLHENDSYSVPERDDGLLAKFVRLEREMCTTESEASGGDDDDVSEEPLLPDWFYDVFPSSAPIRASGSQEDAEEFLTYILNALHEEMIPSKDGMNGIANGHDSVNGEGWEQMTRRGKSVEIRGGEFVASCITRIFGGQLRSEVTRGRGKPSVTREPFFELSLDIESGLIRDVQHALQAYFEPEYLDDYTTTNGGDNTPTARKQVLLEQMPRVLILHLKRFSHNTATGALNKVARMMNFPEILRVPERLVYGRGTGGVYRLVAVVTHVGKELAGGHYTCDVRWGDGWVSCDDSKVLRTALAKVARKQAYLLFYEAVNDQ